MKVGGRTLKTGLSVILAIYVCHLIGIQTYVIAAISAVVGTQASLYRSWKYIRNQINSNIIGAILGIGAVLVFGHSPAVIGLVVILVISVNLALKFDETINMSVITVIIIMQTTDDNYLKLALARFGTIMIGVFCSFLINMFFFPPKYENKLLKEIKTLTNNTLLSLRAITDEELKRFEFKKELKKNKDKLKDVELYFSLLKEEKNYFSRIKNYKKAKKVIVYKYMIQVLKKELEYFQTVHKKNIFQNINEQSSFDLFKEQIALIANYHERIMLKFDGKIQSKHPHEPSVEVFDGNAEVLEKLMKTYESGDEYWLDSLSNISSLIELTGQLDRLDWLIDHFHTTKTKN
jgi:uncharacterized membrane protein YgaE (UPF0421/DUF939 family)